MESFGGTASPRDVGSGNEDELRIQTGFEKCSAAILEILRKQLDIKDQQIAAQNDVIKGLSERVREGNILMGSLQQQLSLTDGSTRNKSEVVDADLPVRKPEKGSDAATESPAKTHWLFRKIF